MSRNAHAYGYLKIIKEIPDSVIASLESAFWEVIVVEPDHVDIRRQYGPLGKEDEAALELLSGFVKGYIEAFDEYGATWRWWYTQGEICLVEPTIVWEAPTRETES
jgi:hypothetical protein